MWKNSKVNKAFFSQVKADENRDDNTEHNQLSPAHYSTYKWKKNLSCQKCLQSEMFFPPHTCLNVKQRCCIVLYAKVCRKLNYCGISHTFQTVRMIALISLLLSLCSRAVQLHLYSIVMRKGTNAIHSLAFWFQSGNKNSENFFWI